ncbi:MAG: hypothetical protein AAGC44_11305 [Planctomycetota bacterium]
MKKLMHLAAVGLITVASVGCAGQRHLRAGDSAYAQGDMRTALYSYQQAASHKSSLYNDPAFVQRMAIAESRVAYQDAQRLHAAGRYEAAVQKLQVAIERDPGFEPAQRLLEQVRPLAAKERLDLAIRAADHGNLALAERELAAAAIHDPGNPDIINARASLTPDRLAPETPGLAAFREAESLARERDWQQARDSAQAAIQQNPYLMPARALRYTSDRGLDASRAQANTGSRFLSEKRIGPALVALRESLAIWPNNESARAWLKQATAAREQADRLYAQTNELASKRKWDDAIAKVAAGLEIDLSHEGLLGLQRELPTRAAEDATRIGREHLTQGRIEEAEQSFRHALSYKRDHEPALRGMAETFDAYGKALEAAGRPGAALLHYHMGRSYARIGTVNEGYDRNFFGIRAGLGIGLDFSVQGGGNPDLNPRLMSSAIGSSLNSAKRAGIAIGNGQPYTIRSRITEAGVDVRLVNRQDRIHKYIVQEWRPNPEHARLVAYYQRENHLLQQLCRRYERQTGHSHHTHDPHYDAHLNRLYDQICRKQDLVNRIQRDLNRCPDKIQVDVEYGWEYIHETHEMTGTLVMQTELIENATGRVIDSFQSRTGFDVRDETVLNPNPEVGLRPDPLELPDPARAAADMAGEVASEITGRAVNAVVQHRLAEMGGQAAALREAGKTQEALEIDVRAAILLGMIDERGMAGMLDRLGREYTR